MGTKVNIKPIIIAVIAIVVFEIISSVCKNACPGGCNNGPPGPVVPLFLIPDQRIMCHSPKIHRLKI